MAKAVPLCNICLSFPSHLRHGHAYRFLYSIDSALAVIRGVIKTILGRSSGHHQLRPQSRLKKLSFNAVTHSISFHG